MADEKQLELDRANAEREVALRSAADHLAACQRLNQSNADLAARCAAQEERLKAAEAAAQECDREHAKALEASGVKAAGREAELLRVIADLRESLGTAHSRAERAEQLAAARRGVLVELMRHHTAGIARITPLIEEAGAAIDATGKK